MSKAEKYLPFILATFIPAISMISNPVDFSGVEWTILTFRYLEASSILLIIWYTNKWLLHNSYHLKSKVGQEAAIIIVNVVIISLVCLIDFLLIPMGITTFSSLWMVVIRFFMITLIFNIILRIFKAQKESAALKYQNLSLQAENLKFQVDLLKQQINPHFLFNSFNTLLDLIEDDANAAVDYVRSFSNLYRVVLHSAKHDFIPLEDELKFLADYWSLLKVRFNDAIDLQIEVSEEKMNDLVPPLSLQFLIENAVKHNEASRNTPLLIEIQENQDRLVVQNKINPKNYPVESEKVGLKNLQQRFTVLYKPIEYGIKDEHFIVMIPLKSHSHDSKLKSTHS
jgi:sensor histidine kinase YesM